MTAPLNVEPGAAEARPEAVAEAGGRRIEGRSLSQLAWMRLKHDKVALGGGVVVLLIVLTAIFAPVLVHFLGHPPNDFHSDLIDPTFGSPKGRFGGISHDFLLGVEPINGRDVFSRIVYGARVSILVAFMATVVAVGLGTLMGVTAGFLGGWVDSLISRTMDVLLAFPLLLFAIALVVVLGDWSAPGLSIDATRVGMLVMIIGFFNWPYVGRIIRGQTLSLREKEFVEAARSLGAGRAYIIGRELLPNLVGPILVYSTLIIPTNILFEAALSYLGVGVRPPAPSWGGMLSQAASGLYYIDPMFMIVPGAALFLTVMSFNLFGDGLRDALDPRTNR